MSRAAIALARFTSARVKPGLTLAMNCLAPEWSFEKSTKQLVGLASRSNTLTASPDVKGINQLRRFMRGAFAGGRAITLVFHAGGVIENDEDGARAFRGGVAPETFQNGQ